MTPIYRFATHADIPALIALVTSAYRGDASRRPPKRICSTASASMPTCCAPTWTRPAV